MECGYPVKYREYTVAPMLVAPVNYCSKRYDDECPPCLPRCSKVVYCCEAKPHRHHCESDHYDHDHRTALYRLPSPPCSDNSSTHSDSYKPVKTKYVVPCYRYEDGRINNQPTLLTKRACEIACNVRPTRKAFSASMRKLDRHYPTDNDHDVCCYRVESKKHEYKTCYVPCKSPVRRRSSNPHCHEPDCVYSHAIPSYYC